MINKTSESAIRTLIFLALRADDRPIAARQIAKELGISPSYLEKVARLLQRAAIVQTHRGARGGIRLSREPRHISLREIIEACQGLLLGSYCEEAADLTKVCGFHQAMAQVHHATVEVLSRWSLAELAARPHPARDIAASVNCRMGDFRQLAILKDQPEQLTLSR